MFVEETTAEPNLFPHRWYRAWSARSRAASAGAFCIFQIVSPFRRAIESSCAMRSCKRPADMPSRARVGGHQVQRIAGCA
jgi:hypothetical protein